MHTLKCEEATEEACHVSCKKYRTVGTECEPKTKSAGGKSSLGREVIQLARLMIRGKKLSRRLDLLNKDVWAWQEETNRWIETVRQHIEEERKERGSEESLR